VGHRRAVTTFGLVFSLLGASVPNPALAQGTTNASNQSLIQRQLNEFGTGADVELTLTDGKSLRGIVGAFEEQTFTFQKKGQIPSSIPYDQVREVRLARRKYRTSGQPDPVEARRAVMALGVGQHVMVRMGREKEFHGKIQIIGQEQFTLLPDRQTAALDISYSEVTHVEQNLSTAAKIGIGMAAGAGVTILVLWLALRGD
jgi:ribosome maturation factor RimP